MEDFGVVGKSRKTKIKRLGDAILEHHAEHFTTNFVENKKMVAEVAVIASKKIRNQVAGYITHTLNARTNEERRMRVQRPYNVNTR
jgi:small subunit ribosomal protein S17e